MTVYYNGAHSVNIQPIDDISGNNDNKTAPRYTNVYDSILKLSYNTIGRGSNGANVVSGGYNTWYDWHLIPSSLPIITQPNLTTKYIDIPGRVGGALDISDYLTGKPTFGSRTGTLKFIVDHEQYRNSTNWASFRSDLLHALHGRKVYIQLIDDPNYYYTGRLTITGWDSEGKYSSVTMTYQLDAYKHPIIPSAHTDDYNLWL